MEATVGLVGVDMLEKSAVTEFSEFFARTWPRLFRTIYAVAGDMVSAEDALQSAFAKAYASWPRVRAVDHPEAYVRRMAVNELLGTRRKAWWKAEKSTAEPPTPDQRDAHDVDIVERDAVWRAIAQLPVGQRAVIVLRYYEDLSEIEIAETLGCTRGTVKSQASAALAALRARSGDLHESGDPS